MRLGCIQAHSVAAVQLLACVVLWPAARRLNLNPVISNAYVGCCEDVQECK